MMMGVESRGRNSIVKTKDAILQEIARLQKPALDQKIDEMLKEAGKTKKITIKFLGRGLDIGRRIGGRVRAGRRVLKKLLRL